MDDPVTNGDGDPREDKLHEYGCCCPACTPDQDGGGNDKPHDGLHIDQNFAALKLIYAFSGTSQSSIVYDRGPVAYVGPTDTIPGDDTTTEVLDFDTPVTAALNAVGDWDWFRFSVTETTVVTFSLSGSGADPVPDTYLRIYDSLSALIGFNDDGGPGLYSELTITLDPGDYFVEAASFGDLYEGEYTLLATALDLGDDTIPADTGTSATLDLLAPVEDALQTAGDRDWFQFEATAAGLYTFTLEGGGALPLTDTVLGLYDASGTLIAENDDRGFFDFFSEIAIELDAGSYFLSAQSFADSQSGSYVLEASFVDTSADTIPADDTTTASVGIGGSFTSTLDFEGDRDWVRLEIAEDTAIQIDLDGTGADPVSDTFLRIYDASGVLIGSNDDVDFPADVTSRLIGQIDAGTYYISAGAFADSLTGEYTITVEEFDLSGFDPLTSIDWGGTRVDTGEENVVTVYFAQVGEVFDGVTSEGWNAYEMGQAMRAFSVYEEYLDVTFEVVDSPEGADFRLVTSGSIGALGYMYPPDEAFGDLQGIGVFNNAPGTGWANTPGGGLEQGGFGFITLIHEFGHGMGLAHPHDAGGGSDIMLGVTGPFGSPGFFDLNQGVFTTMSYNDGFYFGPYGRPTTDLYGYQGTITPFDIALLQERYGARDDINEGDTVWELPDSNEPGTFFSAIWDTGGTDTLLHDGSGDAVLDLRAATLRYELGGGGFVSYVEGIFGGYVIANGVLIENATGGSGNDHIWGNRSGNMLVGNAGDDEISGLNGYDTLYGGDGGDTLMGGNAGDEVYGEAGDDDLFGGKGGDIVFGGEGNDTVRGGFGQDTVSGGEGNDTVNGGGSNDLVDERGDTTGTNLLMGGNGTDTIYASDQNDTIMGGRGRDWIQGGAGDNLIFGGGAADTIYGGDGNDVVWGEAGDNVIYGEGGDDTLYGARPSDLTNDLSGANPDRIYGGDGNDYIRGFGKDDTLSGDAGDDTVLGDQGDEIIFGGEGNDLLTGHSGDDRFVFDDAAGADIVTDFVAGERGEVIEFQGVTDIEDFADLIANHASQSGADTVITWGANQITLEGVALEDLVEDNFEFDGSTPATSGAVSLALAGGGGAWGSGGLDERGGGAPEDPEGSWALEPDAITFEDVFAFEEDAGFFM